MSRSLLLPLLLAVGLLPAAADARHQPAPGGRLSVALSGELLEAARRAHLYAPILEPAGLEDAARRLADPTLPGFDSWRSRVLSGLSRSDEDRSWRLQPSGVNARVLARAADRCLRSGDPKSEWGLRVLRAAGVNAVVAVDGDDVVVRFSRPVGVAPQLLSGCLVEGEGDTPTSAYKAMSARLLAGRPSAPRGPPLVSLVELGALGGAADVVGGSPQSGAGSPLFAPYPDVVVVVQSSAERQRDALGINDDGGLAEFHAGMGADLLLAVYWGERGRATEELLPRGIAPARPLTRPPVTALPGRLALSTLPPDAPRVRVRVSGNDALLQGVAERAAVLLQTRGFAMDQEAAQEGSLDGGVEIMRWRPPVADPALALLSLAGSREEVSDATDPELLADPRLLSAAPEERLAGAMALERVWIDSRVLVPLMTADLWLAVSSHIRGVRVRDDGVPLFHDAYFAGRAR
jgi:hypothetical protein